MTNSTFLSGRRHSNSLLSRGRLWKIIIPFLPIMVSGGCSVPQNPVSIEQQAAFMSTERQKLFENQVPITQAITLEEAVARALKYNYDHKLTVMEHALQNYQVDVARYELLPRVAANAGYTMRSNDSASSSQSYRTGRESLEASISQDRSRANADLSASWNILDFGVSYYAAHQQMDRSLIAAERRRKTIHTILQQVRSAYWQVASAQKIESRVKRVLAEARAALADSRTVEREGLMPPLDALRYQKAVLEIVRELETQIQELSMARTQLAALMNLAPGTPFTVVTPSGMMAELPHFTLSLEEMERVALANRPELREEMYQARISANEVKRAMLKMLPGLTFLTGLNADTNSYLVNHVWAEAGFRLSWNVVNLVSGPAAIQVAEAQEDVGKTRRLALSMAVLAQVHIGVQQYERTRYQYEQARLLNAVEKRIDSIVTETAATDAQSKLERIRSASSALATQMAQDRALADAQSAAASIYVTLGLDPLPVELPDHELPTLAQAVAAVAQQWHQGQIPVPPQPLVPVAAPQSAPDDSAGAPTPGPSAAAQPVAEPDPAPAPAPASIPEPAPAASQTPVSQAPVSQAPVAAPVAASSRGAASRSLASRSGSSAAAAKSRVLGQLRFSAATKTRGGRAL